MAYRFAVNGQQFNKAVRAYKKAQAIIKAGGIQTLNNKRQGL